MTKYRDKTAKKEEQGIALVLVLGIMTVLVGIALTFASSMRLTEKSAKNYYYSLQALYAARAGMHRAIFLLKEDVRQGLGPLQSDPSGSNDSNDSMSDHLNENWHNFFIGTDVQLESNPDIGSRWIDLTEPATLYLGPHIYSCYAVLVKDEAGKINFNAASNYTGKQGMSTFELELKKPFEHDGINDTIADQIVKYRYGADNEAGTSGIDDNNDDHPWAAQTDGLDNNPATAIDSANEGLDDIYEYSLYDPLLSDDAPFHSLEEIKDFDKSGVNDTTFDAIVDDITIYSRGREQYLTQNNASIWEWHNKFCLNYPTSVNDLAKLIAHRKGIALNDEHLQKTLNIIDYVDEDPIPTSAPSLATNDTLYGLEGVRVTEVMAQPEKFYPQMMNDLFDSGTQGAWTWEGVSNSFTANADDLWTGEAEVDIVRAGKYKVYAKAFDDGNAGTDNRFEIRLNGAPIGTTGDHGGNDFAWQEVGLADFSDAIPANNILKLHKTSGNSTISKIQQLLFTQQGNTSHDCEYLELFNMSRRNIDVENWTVELLFGDMTNTTFQIPAVNSGSASKYYNSIIPSNQRLVLVKDVANIGPCENDGNTPIPAFNDTNSDGVNFENTWGDNSGKWGDDNDTIENFPLIQIPGLQLKDIEMVVNLYPPQSFTNPTNNSGLADTYDTAVPPLGDNKSQERVNPVFNNTQFCNDPYGGTPGKTYSNDTFQTTPPYPATTAKGSAWAVKDGPLANIGELKDIYYYNEGASAVETITDNDLGDLADAVTTSYIKLEAEDSMDTPGLPSSPGSYGSKWYQLPVGSGTTTFSWTSGFEDQDGDDAHFISKANNSYYKLFVFGEPGNTLVVNIPVNNQITVSGEDTTTSTNATPLPNRGAYAGNIRTTPDILAMPQNPSVAIEILDHANTAGPSSFDYAVLTPGNPMPGRINLNTATKAKLITALPGITDNKANAIFNNRPYQSHKAFITEIASNTGSLYTSLSMDDYKQISNLITFSSDIFEIIARGQVYYDDGSTIKVLAEQTIRAVVDRSRYRRDDDRDGDPDGPLKTIFYRVVPK